MTVDLPGRSLRQQVGSTNEGVGCICADVWWATAKPASEWNRSTASIVFDQAECRLHTVKATVVAATGD